MAASEPNDWIREALTIRLSTTPRPHVHLIVHGGTPLSRIIPSANKNVLPIPCATLLSMSRPPARRACRDHRREEILVFRNLGSAVEIGFTTGIPSATHHRTHFDTATDRLPEMRSSHRCQRACWPRRNADRRRRKGCTLGAREDRSSCGGVSSASRRLSIKSASGLLLDVGKTLKGQ
jgi:hypothetical protein